MSYAVMPLTDWQNILDSVRTKTGKIDTLVSGNVASEIDSISGDVTPPNDVPTYVKTEAEAVASAVRSVQTGKTLTFATMADTHLGMARTSQQGLDTIKSALMAGQGLAYLRNILPIHAAFVLGDLTWADGAYTVQQVYDDWQGTVDRLSVGFGGLPSAWTTGNHEINYGIGRERSMTEGEINAYVGANSKGFVRPDGKYYGYMDFPIQKIRVIVLNTADTLGEYAESDTTVKAKSEWVGAVQLQWLADTALDFSDKDDASEWGIVICSHHPIAYGGQNGIGRSLQILEAYRDGISGSITYTSDTSHTVSYNFTSGAKAEIICNIHGHNHNFVYKKRSSNSSTGGNVEPWLWSICIPCINCGRENEAATNDALKDNYGDFDASGNPVYYYKTAETRNGTSFCLVTIDRENKTVYAHKFGAGVDRAIYYGEAATYTVTKNLSNCTINNAMASVAEGESYSATVTANSNYALDSVTVTMGGTDITSTAVSGSAINITSVTGDIVITATAIKEVVAPPTSDEWTNRVLEATSTRDGTEIYNGVGYMDGKYASGESGTFGDADGYVTTGFIKYSMTKYAAPTIYIKGVTMDSSDATCRIYFSTASGHAGNNFVVSAYGKFTVLNEDTKYYKLELVDNKTGTTSDTEPDGIIDSYSNFGAFIAFRVTGKGEGKNLIVTLDEPIDTIPTFSVTNNLTDCTNSNSAASVETGSAYSATITANNGYELSTVKVTMGGTDITSTAYSEGNITISSVTGAVVITAVAVEQAPAYTNVLETVGYESGRLSSAGADSASSGYVRTKYIPCKVGDTIRIANVTGLNASDSDTNNHRFSFYDSSKTHLRQLNCSSGAFGSATSAAGSYYNLVFDSSGNIIQFTIPSQDNSTDLSTVGFLRFCTANGGITDSSIVTVNEEII